MDNIIYIYGGQGQIVADVFNGIARLFNSDSEYFTSLGKLSMSIGGIWAATRAIFHTNIGIFGREWFFPMFLCFTFLFTPKSDILIIDVANKNQYSVSNIPSGIAIFSSIPSKISRYLSEEIESNMNVAENTKSSSSGIMYGAKLIYKLKDLKIQDTVLLANAKEYTKQCFIRPWIMGNLLGKRIDAENSKNIYEFMKTNIAKHFGLYYKDYSGDVKFYSCLKATEIILEKIDKESKMPNILNIGGYSKNNEKNYKNDIVRKYLETGNDALKALSIKSLDIHNWVKQSIMLNTYRESLDDFRESSGHKRLWPEILSINATKSLYQQSIGWLIIGEISEEFIPLLQTMIFLIIVSSIFVVFPMSFLQGGVEIVKIWLKSIIWVNTWPIFFSIINSIGLMIIGAKTSSLGYDEGINKLTQGHYSDILIHSYAIMQLIASTIPIISWAFISKSSRVFQGMMDNISLGQVTSQNASSIVDNNINMDNVSIGNRQLSQENVGANLDMSRSINTGALRVSYSSEGGEFLNQNQTNLATNFRGSLVETTALNNSYQEQESILKSINERKGHLASLEESQIKDYATRWLETRDVGENENSSISDSMREVQQNGKNYSINNSSSMKAGIDLKFLGTSKNMDFNQNKSESYQKALENVRNYIKNTDSRESLGVSSSISENINSTWREQEQVAKDESHTLQNMKNIQSQLSHINSNQYSIDQNWNDNILEKIQEKYSFNNKEEALNYLDKNHKEGEEILKDNINKKYNIKSNDIISDMKNNIQNNEVISADNKYGNYQSSFKKIHNKPLSNDLINSNFKEKVEDKMKNLKKNINQIPTKTANK